MVLDDRPPPPYVRQSEPVKAAHWKVVPKVIAVAEPGPPFTRCSVCNVGRPSSGPGYEAHVVGPRHQAMVQRAEERERALLRQAAEEALQSPMHRGHVSLGIACNCAKGGV